MINEPPATFINISFCVFFQLSSALFSVSLFAIMELCSSKECYQCKNLPHPRSCESLINCGQDHTCYVEKVVVTGNTLYNSGYMLARQCPQTGSPVPIGKRNLPIRQSHGGNIECCHQEHCNNEAFGLTLIPKVLRGPLCFQCHYETNLRDPVRCYITHMC